MTLRCSARSAYWVLFQVEFKFSSYEPVIMQYAIKNVNNQSIYSAIFSVKLLTQNWQIGLPRSCLCRFVNALKIVKVVKSVELTLTKNQLLTGLCTTCEKQPYRVYWGPNGLSTCKSIPFYKQIPHFTQFLSDFHDAQRSAMTLLFGSYLTHIPMCSLHICGHFDTKFTLIRHLEVF